MGGSLGVITLSRATFELFSSQITEFYDNQISIEGFYLQGGECKVIKARHVLVSDPMLMKSVTAFLGPETEVFFAHRTVDLSRVVPLFDLPRGTRVLVANVTRESATEAIGLLQELGLDHLTFIPYWPGKPHGEVETDVVAAPVRAADLLQLPSCDKVIDIGMRPLDLSTLAEIGVRLHLPLDKAKTAAIRQMREIVALTKRQIALVERLNEANERLKAVIDSVRDGIISVDPSGKIAVMNSLAKKMLGLRGDMIGRPVEDLPAEAGLIGKSGSGEAEAGKLIRVGGKEVFICQVRVSRSAGRLIIIRDVTELQRIERDVRERLRDKGYVPKYSFDDIVGSSKKIRHTVEVARKLAATDMTVLIIGENGTGKELFAHAIHTASPVRDGPFIAVNSSALPENLVESELFGYEEGAFTGARRGGKAGLFEQAHNGTIFLDEVGDLPLSVQIRLLRVLQERDIMRIGASRVIPVNVRVIAATNRDLLELVREGSFRKDLYYRLCLSLLRIPPLRERKEDIDQLVSYFLKKYGGPQSLPPSVMSILRNHDWPGNVRELEGVVRYLACVACDDAAKMEEILADIFPSNTSRLSEAEEFQLVAEALSRKAALEEYRAVLATLVRAQAARLRYGRHSIHRDLEVARLGLTPQKIRLRLKAMSNEGLVHVGKGRQGTTVTARGLRFFGYLNACREEWYTGRTLK